MPGFLGDSEDELPQPGAPVSMLSTSNPTPATAVFPPLDRDPSNGHGNRGSQSVVNEQPALARKRLDAMTAVQSSHHDAGAFGPRSASESRLILGSTTSAAVVSASTAAATTVPLNAVSFGCLLFVWFFMYN